jgi:hypothetical protein
MSAGKNANKRRVPLRSERGEKMDNKKSIGGIVLFGIGLLLIALGFFILVTIIGIPSHEGEEGTLLKTLLGLFFFICGLASTISGGIMIYISRKS